MDKLDNRTNIGLRLTEDEMIFLKAKCDEQARPMANYVRFLIVEQMKRERNDIDTGAKSE